MGETPRRHAGRLPPGAPGLLDLPRLRRELPDLKETRGCPTGLPKTSKSRRARRGPSSPPTAAWRPGARSSSRSATSARPRPAAGLALSPEEREAAVRCLTDRRSPIPTPVEGPYYAHRRLRRHLQQPPRARRAAGGRGPPGRRGGLLPGRPRRLRPQSGEGPAAAGRRAACCAIQGNYEESLASGREDCNCGYTDPRDNHFAEHLLRLHRAELLARASRPGWARSPRRRRVRVGERELLLVHGSPRRINEFLFQSTSPVPFLEVLLDQNRLRRHPRAPTPGCTGTAASPRAATWSTSASSAARPTTATPTSGTRCSKGATRASRSSWCRSPTTIQALAAEMRAEGLPEEFVETILTGWWTTCLEILPARERAASRF